MTSLAKCEPLRGSDAGEIKMRDGKQRCGKKVANRTEMCGGRRGGGGKGAR